MSKLTNKERAFSILSNYKGNNPYMLILKKSVYIDKNLNAIGDFQEEFIIKNEYTEPKQINKVIPIADWYAKSKVKKDNNGFSSWQWDDDGTYPQKIKIISFLGETSTTYVCYIQYRQSVKHVLCLLPKKAVLKNFLVEDYTKLQLDFSWFDKKLKSINPNFHVLPHQKKGTQFLLSRKKCVLSMDMGMGKTMTSIIASLMYGHKKVLVICPASIKSNWKTELMNFVDEDSINIIKSFNEMNKSELMDFLGITDKSQYKVEELREMAKERGKWKEGKQFTILNFDIIDDFHKNSRNKTGEDSDLIKSDFDIVIIDEAHKLSNNTSNRFKVIRNYLKKANNEYTWLLTGTMLTNDISNLYNMISLIENDITGDYKFFMERYCGAERILKKGEWDRCWKLWNKANFPSYTAMTPKNKEAFKKFVDRVGSHVMVKKGANNLEELNERISHLYFRVMKDELMDVEKKIIPVVYNLSDEQKKEYDNLWEKYYQEKLEEGKDVADIKQLIEIAVNRQYISSIMVPNTIKLAEKLLSNNLKVFIVCSYDEELYTLQQHFGDKCVIYNGKMDSKQKDKSVDLFNNNPDVTVFIGQIRACGVGINLNKACNHVIFQNLSFTDAEFSQACDRIFRIGTNKDAYVYLQYFKNTVSEKMVDIITQKRIISEKVINNN